MKTLTINLTNNQVPFSASPEIVIASLDLGSIVTFVASRLTGLLNEIHAKHNIQTFGKIELYVRLDSIAMAAIAFLSAALPIHPDVYVQMDGSFQYLGLWTFEIEGNDWKQTYKEKEVIEGTK